MLIRRDNLLVQSQETHRDMGRLETSLREEIVSFKAELREEIASLAASLRVEIANGDASVRGELGQLRTSMAEWRGELRAEIQAAASSGVRQMYMALLGQMAVLLGFAYFFAVHVR